MKKLNLKSYAKINLSLLIGDKTKNNYHNLKSIMQTVSLKDKIKLKKNKKIICKTNSKNIPTNEENLAVKAAKIFFNHLNLNTGVLIKIKKKIPTKAGLAGASSNAAATLLGLNKLYKTNLCKKTLLNLAKKIGSDVCFLICGGTSLVKGTGDLVFPLTPLKECYFLIVKPNFNISTKNAYEKFDQIKKSNVNFGLTEKILNFINQNEKIKKTAKFFFNDFEQVFEKNSEIFKIKKQMFEKGAISSILTGSGSCVFGVFNNKKKAKLAKKYFKKQKLLTFLCTPIKKYF